MALSHSTQVHILIFFSKLCDNYFNKLIFFILSCSCTYCVYSTPIHLNEWTIFFWFTAELNVWEFSLAHSSITFGRWNAVCCSYCCCFSFSFFFLFWSCSVSSTFNCYYCYYSMALIVSIARKHKLWFIICDTEHKRGTNLKRTMHMTICGEC